MLYVKFSISCFQFTKKTDEYAENQDPKND